MHDNAFGPIGVAQFKDFLTEAKHLRILSVSNCGLGPEASETIFDALISNGSVHLEKLCISRSRVETKGAHALSRYLDTYSGLKHLEIFQNGIRGTGSTALVNSLQGHTNLKHALLNDNYFSCDSSRAALFTLLRTNSTLEYLDIGSSNLDKDDESKQGYELI
mmetsp:Transcript_28677/g.35527  ORF Transcript_28677/g.35527 Transcript_28677/m.35527 type:complete len:163 (+) Transcript_28677:692-1180(+)